MFNVRAEVGTQIGYLPYCSVGITLMHVVHCVSELPVTFKQQLPTMVTCQIMELLLLDFSSLFHYQCFLRSLLVTISIPGVTHIKYLDSNPCLRVWWLVGFNVSGAEPQLTWQLHIQIRYHTLKRIWSFISTEMLNNSAHKTVSFLDLGAKIRPGISP